MQTSSVTLESLYAELQAVKALLQKPAPSISSNEEDQLLTPTEVCKLLKISRSQFERMKNNGFIQVARNLKDPKSRKIYVSRIELFKTFRKDFSDQTAL
ncbi:helix-turn-helix transcriptional regulator [Runella aurantiaca]|uniref:DNA-binding protein n=1 Tax=Runella aurantiaca TaxID=2282308 RepID=A0A369I7K5_9BACT|nr:helix-turn-helix domain-containing protein [Runella aurantiaca]RDB05608.1 DNA-binding protein [Runella aurantiaca]